MIEDGGYMIVVKKQALEKCLYTTQIESFSECSICYIGTERETT